MGKSTAAIVWYHRFHGLARLFHLLTFHHRGMPVQFMRFLWNLDAFRKAIPTIHTLRMCNQFGKGENAGVNKLPKELIGFIEEELLALYRWRETSAALTWTRKYRCYEGSCRSREHGVVVNYVCYEDSSDDDKVYYGSDSDSESDRGDYVWEMCWEHKGEWQDHVRKHMEVDGYNEVGTAFRTAKIGTD